MAAVAQPADDKIPVTVVTGFLGSGKTTAIRAALAGGTPGHALVIVNEFGEIALDHELLATSSESVRLLPSGCLCCAVRTDLEETLRELFVERERASVARFDRVLIETSGLADPGPIANALRADPWIAAHVRLAGVVTLIDAVNGRANLDRFPEALAQVSRADRLIITKCDLAQAEVVDLLAARLSALNPLAVITRAMRGAIDASAIVDVAPNHPSASMHVWLGNAAEDAYLGRVATRHSRDVLSFALTFDRPLPWSAFANTLQLLVNMRGADLLRVKGLVAVAGESGPTLLHGAQHAFDAPVSLAEWPSEDRRSRLVFITRGIKREPVAALFDAAARIATAVPVSR